MDTKMFCFQCEQTINSACIGAAGRCGKKSDTAHLQDVLTSELILLARAATASAPTGNTAKLMMEGLFTTVTNVNFNNKTLTSLIEKVRAEKTQIVAACKEPACPCKGNDTHDMQTIWTANEDIRSLKSLILFGLRGLAAYAHHAAILGYTDKKIDHFLTKALAAIGDDKDLDALLPLVLETGEISLVCMALLDTANTESYGTPVPVTVSMTIEKGPFIVITGHDLYDLKQLLEQTKNKGVTIYTHGEMLPAHGYPELKKYTHLKGHFGTAWQSQQKEFDGIPAPILFTTNCIMPPKSSYADRVFTTDLVSYPDIQHIGQDKDFTAVINKALALGGYTEDTTLTGVNGGSELMTGFGHGAVLSHAGTILEGIEKGAIKHFFVVGGCDGATPGRNYFTEFVQQTPQDSLVLTVGCGKFRFNDMNIGSIAGIPRILDMGQCNDAYGAIKVAIALAEALKCEVNDLPLSIVLSWFEQKAVCVLLALLHLDIKNIILGPTLPAFISPNVLKILVEKYAIAPISTPKADLERLLAK